MPDLTDSEPLIINIPALERDRRPEHLNVIGGRDVGLQFRQRIVVLGHGVTILQHAPQLLAYEHPDGYRFDPFMKPS